ncbi:MAG: hypothetical protein O7I42_08515 [Alphaproteobacteria bacterium]|nr:hypothetical protein [Alphaproteobacteria bacterium]
MAPPPERQDSLFRFAAPVFPAFIGRKDGGGPVQVILTSNDGQGWAINIVEASVRPDTPVPIKMNSDATISEWSDLAGDKVLACRDYGKREWLGVWDIRNGDTILDELETDNAFICPDGDHLLLFADDGIAVVDLRQPTKPARKSGVFPIGQQDAEDDPERRDWLLDNPGSVMAVQAEPGTGTFTLAIGDYGFAVVADVRLGDEDEPPLIVTKRTRRYHEGLVYDPVEILDVVPGESLVVLHGHGCGVTRFDLQTGVEASCPLPLQNPEPRYGAFRRIVTCSATPGLWVLSDVGPYFWNGTGPVERVPDEACAVIATDGARFLGLSPDGWDLVQGQF